MNKLNFTSFFSFWTNRSDKQQELHTFSDNSLEMTSGAINAVVKDIERGNLLDAIEMLINNTRHQNDEVYNYLLVKKGRVRRRIKDKQDKIISQEELDNTLDEVNATLISLLQSNIPEEKKEQSTKAIDLIAKPKYKTN